MLSSDGSVEPKKRAAFSLRSLLFAVTLVAWILSVNNWLGTPYGWLTAIPLSIGVPVYLTRPRAFGGAVVGFIVFLFLGEFWFIGWEPNEPRYLPSMLTVGAYGSTVGSSLHAFFLGQRILAGLTCVVTLVTFAIVLHFG